eukprot:12038577-Prorocentrum_lima.AAC.1
MQVPRGFTYPSPRCIARQLPKGPNQDVSTADVRHACGGAAARLANDVENIGYWWLEFEASAERPFFPTPGWL